MKVVLDTNVFISGIFWKGIPNRILLAWKAEKYSIVVSEEILAEMKGVLSDFKISLPKDQIDAWLGLIRANSVMVNPKTKIAIVSDPDDDKFIEAALEGSAQFIITRDKALLKVKEYMRIRTITPEEFVAILEDG